MYEYEKTAKIIKLLWLVKNHSSSTFPLDMLGIIVVVVTQVVV
jgi:hypothetical protein